MLQLRQTFGKTAITMILFMSSLPVFGFSICQIELDWIVCDYVLLELHFHISHWRLCESKLYIAV